LLYSYRYSRQIILEESRMNARNLAYSVARRVGQEFRAVEKIPQNMACVLETTPLSERTLDDLLKCSVTNNREIYGCAIAFEPYALKSDVKASCPYCYKEGNTVRLVELGTDDYRYFQRDWYHIPRVMRVPVWSQPYFDEGGGGVLMTTYSCPFFERSADGLTRKLKGVVTADVSLDWLTKLVSSLEIGKNGYCFIISDTGKLVTYPKTSWIMRESLFSLADEHQTPLLRTVGRHMIRSESGFEDMGTALTEDDSFVAFARIPSTNWVLAAVFAKSELFAEVMALHRATLLFAVLGVLLLALVAMFVSRSMAKPLRRMAVAAEKVAKGDLNIDLSDIRTTDEIGQLASSFVRMTEGLRDRDFIRDTFGRYLTKEVVNRLLESKDGLRLGGEAREITLLMSDLRGFSALTSKMNPEQVITFLNRYLGKMVEILLDHRGTIDEIIGDGILAFFGAPEPMDDHQERAVACALEMQEAMEGINALNEAEGLPHLEMGVAVHTGKVVVGNIGSERRSKYGAVGSDVNYTGRIEGFTLGGQLLISHATYQAVSDEVDVKKVLEVQMKGFPGTVSLYDVTGIRGAYHVKLRDRDQTPVALTNPIKVFVHRLDGKSVDAAELAASITHVSGTTARVAMSCTIGLWEDVKMLLVDDNESPTGGEVYGKVVTVTEACDECEVLIRFTSVSPDVYAMFRKLTAQPA
jgi:sigma-B regulation protein RsbU (phosphoserine phosphatase)